MEKTKVYSPNQLRVGAFLGGPPAAVYLLRENFLQLGNGSAAKKTLMWGLILAPPTLYIAYILAGRYTWGFSLVSMLTAGFVGETYQITRTKISESQDYTFQSIWRVLFLSLFVAAVCMAVVIGALFVFFLVMGEGANQVPGSIKSAMLIMLSTPV